VARSERVRSVLTHASCTEIFNLNFSSVRVSNTQNCFQQDCLNSK